MRSLQAATYHHDLFLFLLFSFGGGVTLKVVSGRKQKREGFFQAARIFAQEHEGCRKETKHRRKKKKKKEKIEPNVSELRLNSPAAAELAEEREEARPRG